MADDDLRGAVLDGRYRVIAPIAAGAMGAVYRGERLKLGRAVAIKVMHQELPDQLASRQRFEREAKLMALLDHPNCVSVIDFGVHDDKPFLVMDLVRGTSLATLLEQPARLDVARATDLMRQVLSGLAHAHEVGIVHRDIKPANLMISEKAGLGEQVQILDFGLARMTDASPSLTTGIAVGTPNYMAPEQCKGGDVDARTDLYACGVVLFEMLAGRKPFVASDPLQVVRKHLLEEPPTLASIDPLRDFGDLEAVVARALSKRADARYGSAVEMARALELATSRLHKLAAAAVFGRAVPSTSAGAGTEVATASGWQLPAAADASTASPQTNAGPPPLTRACAPIDAPSGGEASRGSPDQSTQPALPGARVHGVAGAPAGVVGSPADVAGAPAGVVGAVAGNGGSPADDGGVMRGGEARALEAGEAIAPASTVSGPGAGRRRGGLTRSARSRAWLAGGLVLLAGALAVAVGAGGAVHPPAARPRSASPGAAEDELGGAAGVEPTPVTAARARAMVERGEYEAAVALLRRARARDPESGELALLAGQAYFGRLWWTDGVESFRAAIRLDPRYRESPELLKAVLKGFLTTPDVDERIVWFMRRDIGPPLRPYLEETARSHPKVQLRARARAELDLRRE